MSDFSDVFGDNPGVSLDATRNAALSNLNADGRGFPVLLRDASRLGPPATPAHAAVPVHRRDHRRREHLRPDLQVPYSQTWTGGVRPQDRRATSASTSATSARATCRAGSTTTTTRANILENGFLNEFRKAQANLQANIAAGRGNTFAYTGAPGTVAAADLPRLLHRHRAARRRATRRSTPAARGPARTSRTRWRSATRIRSRRPAPTPTPASTATRRAAPTRSAAGLPRELLPRQPGSARGA